MESPATQTIGLIVSKSATAPLYASISSKTHVFYTRKLTGNTPRTFYLSVTDKTPQNSTNFTETSHTTTLPTGTFTEDWLSDDSQYLAAATLYYIYVYRISESGGTLVKTQPFTTASIPSDSEFAAFTGNGGASYDFLKMPEISVNIDMKVGEALLIPQRYAGVASNMIFLVDDSKYITCSPGVRGGCVVEAADVVPHFVSDKYLSVGGTDRHVLDILYDYRGADINLVELRISTFVRNLFTIRRVIE